MGGFPAVRAVAATSLLAFVACVMPPAVLAVAIGLTGLLLLPLMLVPFAALLLYWYFALFLIVTERRGPFAAMRRSFQLVRGHWWRISVILIVAYFLHLAALVSVGVVGFLLGFLASGSNPSVAVLLFVINVVTGGASVGAALTAHPGIDKITFTGGGETARHVARAAAGNLVSAVLELGGKSPQVIFDDADPEAAANGLLAGIFAASGQTCIAGSRAYVQSGIAAEIIERVTESARGLVLGDPADPATEMGPAASDAQRDRILAMVRAAEAGGATINTGGIVDPDLGGRFVRPTVITGVSNETTIVREEVFGPVLAVMTFDDEAEAVALANDSDFGLAAGVWTLDVRRAHRMARALHAGTVWINTYRNVSYMAPFGGFKRSGYGKDNGREALDGYLMTKTVWVELTGATRDPFVVG